MFRLDLAGSPARYIKVSSGEDRTDLIREAERLTWLTGRLPVPELVQLAHHEAATALVTSALPGESLVVGNQASAGEREAYAFLLGAALRRFHDVDITNCPFLHVSAGRSMQPDGLADPVKMRIYDDLIERFSGDFPAAERRVLLHGDPSLPNIIVQGFALSGFVDLGSVGVGDALRDVALALWSLEYNYGPGFAEDLFAGYGLSE